LKGAARQWIFQHERDQNRHECGTAETAGFHGVDHYADPVSEPAARPSGWSG
jgi:hypothetical protein